MPTGGGANTANPINIGARNKFLVEDDIPANSAGLQFQRVYNSLVYTHPSEVIGAGWQHNYNLRLTILSDRNRASAFRADGRIIRFMRAPGSTTWITDADITDRLQTITDSGGAVTGYQLIDGKTDRVESYDSVGNLTSVDDPRALQAFTFTYDGNLRLKTVSDKSGRQLQIGYDSLGRISDVWPPDSILGNPNSPHWHYSYDANNRLVSVTTPSNTTRTYTYENISYPYALTGIVDENNSRYVTYAYDAQGRPSGENLWSGPSQTFPVGQYTLSYQANNLAQVTDPLGLSRDLQFTLAQRVAVLDNVSHPCALCGGSGMTKSRTYDPASGFTNQTTDFNGVVTDYDYDARGLEGGRTEAANDAAGDKRTIQTDWHLSFRVPKERRTLNATGAIEARTQWTYNTRGQATARCEIDPADTMAYTCSATTAPEATARVRRTVTTYCEDADVTAGTCPLVGLVTSVNGPRPANDAGMAAGQDDITTYTYYQTDDATCASNGACTHRHSDLWKVTNALGHVTEYVSYDKAGRVTRMKDANGTYTDFAYHPRGWLTDRIVRASATGAAGSGDAITHIDYDAVGNVKKVTQPDGAYLAYVYDDAHRLIKITDNLNNAIDYCPGGVGSADCLDAAGNRRVEQVKDSSGSIQRAVRRQYDQLGRLQKVLNAANDPTFDATNGYDGNGNLIQSADGLNVVTHQTYDGLNRLVKTIQDYTGLDPATQGAETGYKYDTRDNLREVSDPDGLTTIYDYDGLNNLTGLHSPDTGDTGYTYDKAGNRISQTDARGVTSTYTYDALNRLTAITYPTASLNVGYFYDQPNSVTGCATSYPAGRLTRMTDASGSTTYCYDRRGNVLRKVQQTAMTATCGKGVAGCGGSSMSPPASGPGGVGGTVANPTTTTVQTLVTQYAYTTADRLASITYPSGAVVGYVRDALGRITQVTWRANATASPVTVVANASYYPFGPLNQLTWGNGRTLTKVYDADYAISRVTSSTAGGLALRFEVDVMGNPVGLGAVSGTAGAVSGPGLSPYPYRYAYDALGRLTESWISDLAATPLEAYTYNKTGDRLSATLGAEPAQPYTYAAGTHRLASVAGIARSYDANGNTTSSGLSYDDRNRLRGWNLVNGQINLTGHSALYGYNGRGERVSKQGMQVCEPPDCYPVPGAPSGWLTGTVAYGYDENGQLLTEWPGPYSTSVGGDTIYLNTLPVAVVRNGTVYAIETDHLGTPRLAFNLATNATVWSWSAVGSAFGTHEPMGALTLNLRFPGQYYDAETGLNYNYFRDYEPGTGRYVESDPIGLMGGVNTYAYVGARPLTRFDPTGLFAPPAPPIMPPPAPPTGLWPMLAPMCRAVVANPIVAGIIGVALPSSTSGCDQPYPPPGNNCQDDGHCPPCVTVTGTVVPVGTIGYRPLDTPSKPQHGITGSHYNIYKANQAPKNSPQPCKCFWQPIGAVPPSGLPPGSIPIEPFVN